MLTDILAQATPTGSDATGFEQLVGWFSWEYWWAYLVAFFMLYMVSLGIALLIRRSFRTYSEIDERAQNRVIVAESRVEKEPNKVGPAWELARATLEAYFSRNLTQITWIFWLSVLVMLAGFMVIIWGILQALSSPNTVAPALITAASGVITEFIGATFLFIYRSAIEQAAGYSRTLERINSVGMAMQILDTMPDDAIETNLKSKTKAKLVELLVQQAHDKSEKEDKEIQETANKNTK